MSSRSAVVRLRLLGLCAAFSAVNLAAAFAPSPAATPTPIPGGANQVKALSGTVGTWLFNGKYRLKIISVGDATPEQLAGTSLVNSNGNGKKVIAFPFQMRLGTNKGGDDIMAITITDADDDSSTIPSGWITPNPTPSVTQGAGWKGIAFAIVPTDYKLAKMVITFPGDTHYQGFRITIK